MIRIKEIDALNILDVCELTTNKDGTCMAIEGNFCCNAVCIAKSKYNSEIYTNAIYNNNVIIGFFMYERKEELAETAMIYRFMIDDRFKHKRLEEKALEYILRGLKIQGVRKVILAIDNADENAKNLYLSFGFQFTGKIVYNECYYQL